MPGPLAIRSLDQCVRYTTDQVTGDLIGLLSRPLAHRMARQVTCQLARPLAGHVCALWRAKPCSDKEYGVRSVNYGDLNFHAASGWRAFRERRRIFEVANHRVHRLHLVQCWGDDPISATAFEIPLVNAKN